MKIEEIKKEMLAFRDFYGASLLESEAVKNAATKEELAEIMNRHKDHIIDQSNDATASLDRFTRKIGLYFLD